MLRWEPILLKYQFWVVVVFFVFVFFFFFFLLFKCKTKKFSMEFLFNANSIFSCLLLVLCTFSEMVICVRMFHVLPLLRRYLEVNDLLDCGMSEGSFWPLT